MLNTFISMYRYFLFNHRGQPMLCKDMTFQV